MALRKSLKCPKCSRMFSMPGHLARHVNSMHGRGPGRPKGSFNAPKFGRGPGRPRKMTHSGLGVPGFDAAALSMEQLRDVITIAREEAHRRLREYQTAF